MIWVLAASAAHADEALLARHAQFPGCEVAGEVTARARLDARDEIAIVLCSRHAYQSTFAVYVIREGNIAQAQRMYFAEYAEELGWFGTDRLFEAEYADGELRSLYKGRGLGDCGSEARYRWTGFGFQMLEYRHEPDCESGQSPPWAVKYPPAQ